MRTIRNSTASSLIGSAARRGIRPAARRRRRTGTPRCRSGARPARGRASVVIEGGVARLRIVVAAKADPLHRHDCHQIEQQRSENAPFGDRHGFPRRAAGGDSIEIAIILTRYGPANAPEATEVPRNHDNGRSQRNSKGCGGDESGARRRAVGQSRHARHRRRPGVRVYLKEFLSDPRVIEDQGLLWKLVLNGIILRVRPAARRATT